MGTVLGQRRSPSANDLGQGGHHRLEPLPKLVAEGGAVAADVQQRESRCPPRIRMLDGLLRFSHDAAMGTRPIELSCINLLAVQGHVDTPHGPAGRLFQVQIPDWKVPRWRKKGSK